jgi:DNA-binding XRE family transcriptional regulator
MKTRIKELRARYDLTQEDLAKLVGVRRETILAKALQTSIDELFIFDDD